MEGEKEKTKVKERWHKEIYFSYKHTYTQQKGAGGDSSVAAPSVLQHPSAKATHATHTIHPPHVLQTATTLESFLLLGGIRKKLAEILEIATQLSSLTRRSPRYGRRRRPHAC